MGPRFSFRVLFSTLASINPAASSSSACCASMSGVWNVERVNIPSEAYRDALVVQDRQVDRLHGAHDEPDLALRPG